MTTTLTLAQLNEKITETVEPKPEAGELRISKRWCLKHADDGTPFYEPVVPFTADVGAIIGLMREKGVEAGTKTCDGTFLVVAWHEGEVTTHEYWSGGKDDHIAPALCCALWFALKGERVEVVEG